MSTRPRNPVPFSTNGTWARGLVAAFGGYMLSSVTGLAAAAWLPLSAAEATVTASLVAIPVFVGAVLWAFAARTPVHAALGVLIPAVTLLFALGATL